MMPPNQFNQQQQFYQPQYRQPHPNQQYYYQQQQQQQQQPYQQHQPQQNHYNNQQQNVNLPAQQAPVQPAQPAKPQNTTTNNQTQQNATSDKQINQLANNLAQLKTDTAPKEVKEAPAPAPAPTPAPPKPEAKSDGKFCLKVHFFVIFIYFIYLKDSILILVVEPSSVVIEKSIPPSEATIKGDWEF